MRNEKIHDDMKHR